AEMCGDLECDYCGLDAMNCVRRLRPDTPHRCLEYCLPIAMQTSLSIQVVQFQVVMDRCEHTGRAFQRPYAADRFAKGFPVVSHVLRLRHDAEQSCSIG